MEISTRHQPNAGDFVLWRVNSLHLPATVAILNAVECPIHLNGASQSSALGSCYVLLTAVKRSGLLPRIHVFRNNPQVVR